MKFFLKLLNNKLLIAKIIFSVYNLVIILILNFFFDARLAGELLYIQGMIYFIAALSRFGSDYYWVSLTNKQILISKFEFLILLCTTILFTLIYYYFFVEKESNNYFWVLSSVIQVNIINFIGRYYQKEEKHISSLFMFILAPSLFVVPILWFNHNINIYMLVAISMSIILFIIYIMDDFQFQFEYKEESIYNRLNYFPIIIYGIVNQNLIATLGGLIGKEEQSAILVLFQRLSGIVLWPQIFHMQKDLNKIHNSLKTWDTFKNYFKLYIKENIIQVLFYCIVALVISFVFLFRLENFNFYTILALLLILFSTVVNVVFGYIQVQIGHSKNGVFSILVLIISLIVIYMSVIINDVMYITIAFSYLLFHIINHLANYFIIKTWLTK